MAYVLYYCNMVSGALIPECNDLSQFNKHTGKPSMLVREFNLIACLLA